MQNAQGDLLINGSMATNVASNLIPCAQRAAIAITAEWTGSPQGTILLQLSTEEDKDSIFGENVSEASWKDYEDTDFIVSGDGTMSWIEPWPFYRWLRVLYKAASGTGILNVRFNGKSL